MEPTTTTIKKTTNFWDWAGVFFSSLCVIHCIATPLLLAGAAVWIASEWIHVSMLLLLIPIVIMASMRPCPAQKKRQVVFIFISGLALLGAALLMEERVGEVGEIVLTVAGSSLLIAGHLKNRRMHLANGS